jgi:lysyl-tRNA synthetase class 2
MKDDFLPTCGPEVLKARAEVVRRIRKFFDDRGFVEVDTPLLSADTVVDRYIDPVSVTLFDDPRRPTVGQPMWLQTSPEFAMKRLLSGGMTAIYQIAHAVRGGEVGARHNPEFSILEWYRVGDDYAQGRNLLAAFAREMFGVRDVEEVSYAECFQRAIGINPHLATANDLQQVASATGVYTDSQLDRDGWLNLLLAEYVEPTLGQTVPTILYDYPTSQAALAKTRTVCTSDGRSYDVAERFELYFRGFELANGYHELLDANILLSRNQAHNDERVADGRYELPGDSRLLAAMRHGLPPCSGVALGLERLLMALWGKSSISQVIPFPIDRA